MRLTRESNNTFWFFSGGFSGIQLFPQSHLFPGIAVHAGAVKCLQNLFICVLFLTSN